MNYNVNINISDEVEEDFNSNDDNLGKLTVINQNGEDITQNSHVMLTLSKNGLLGLGKELIRLAHKFKDGYHYHLDPIANGEACQKMGIYLTPDSSELILSCGDFKKTVDDYIKESKNYNK